MKTPWIPCNESFGLNLNKTLNKTWHQTQSQTCKNGSNGIAQFAVFRQQRNLFLQLARLTRTNNIFSSWRSDVADGIQLSYIIQETQRSIISLSLLQNWRSNNVWLGLKMQDKYRLHLAFTCWRAGMPVFARFYWASLGYRKYQHPFIV